MRVGWIKDPSFWSANRAEHARVGAYELVAFDLPASKAGAAEIGWEVFGPPDWQTQLVTGQSASFEGAKRAAEAAFLKIAGS